MLERFGKREASGLRAVDRRFRPPQDFIRRKSIHTCEQHLPAFSMFTRLAVPRLDWPTGGCPICGEKLRLGWNADC
jgi:hypothetical protein